MMSNAVNGVTCNACVKTQTKMRSRLTLSNCRKCVFPKQSAKLVLHRKSPFAFSGMHTPSTWLTTAAIANKSNLWMKHIYKFAKRSPRDVTYRLRSKWIGRQLELPYSVASHSLLTAHSLALVKQTPRLAHSPYIFEMMSNAIIIFSHEIYRFGPTVCCVCEFFNIFIFSFISTTPMPRTHIILNSE